MLQNPIHLRRRSWKAGSMSLYGLPVRTYVSQLRDVLQANRVWRRPALSSYPDLIWETLTVKDAKVNFDSQLEKLEEAIPAADDFDMYGVYPAIDACVALSELIHSRLSGETLEHAIEVSKTSITTVAMLEMTRKVAK